MRGLLLKNCTFLDSSAGGVYCEGGRIARIYRGGEPAVRADAAVVDANGGTVLPGLIDTHCHPFEYAWLKKNLDLRGTSNIVALRLRIQAGVLRAKPGEWVVGMGWDQEAFPDRRMPRKEDIDGVSPANPVLVTRVCGHIGLVNSVAIRRLGLGSRTGPLFERDQAGDLTGIVKEGALTEVWGSIPRTAEELAAGLQAVESEGTRLGLTAFHTIVSPDGFREELSALALLATEERLALSHRVYVPPDSLEFLEERKLRSKLAGPRARLNGVKIFTDGSLGARTAALRAPYADDPSNSGLLAYGDEELAALVERVDSMGMQAIVHAIGDRAVEQAIGALSKVTGATNPRRHRIEHAGLLPRDLRSQMARHGIRAAVQPCFVTSDTWAVERLGEERIRDLYPFRSMLSEGLVASGGSDCPVESLSPVLGVWAAMTRGGIVPEEAIGMGEALQMYTSMAVSNGLDERPFAEGAPADLTLLDSAVAGMHPALFRKVKPLATVVEGAPVHSYGLD
ncbi:MAG: amidohydrolase [Nitrososphaerota archaeon]|nr:amidohydrolase [Nitrososphaerota archaeon]MDG7026119.1 amidohydrolase [Nitrososphaerota archaeon]